MTQGTTPTLSLMLPSTSTDLTEAAHVYATLEQGRKRITMSDEDLTVSAHQVDVYLTQEQTLQFVGGSVAVQLNWVYADNSRASSTIAKVDIGRNLLLEVIP